LRYLIVSLLIGIVTYLYLGKSISGWLVIVLLHLISAFNAKLRDIESDPVWDTNDDNNFEKDTTSESPPKEDIIYDPDELKFGRILGLKGRVNKSDIKKAYKKKMKEYHPDRVSTMADELKELALNRTKEINNAYEYFKKKYGE